MSKCDEPGCGEAATHYWKRDVLCTSIRGGHFAVDGLCYGYCKSHAPDGSVPIEYMGKGDMLILEAIHSGGQTGADIAGLDVAKKLKLWTGGWATQGCRTHEGQKQSLVSVYGLRETDTPHYRDWTFLNVRDADATVRFAYNFYSTGEICTLRAIQQYQKPYLDIPVYFDDVLRTDMPHSVFRDWLTSHKVKVLNWAGNSEKSAPGIYVAAYNWLLVALSGHVKEKL